MLTFQPKWRVIGKLAEHTEEEVRNEPMLLGADRGFAWESGGPITREFIGAALSPDVPWVIDSKVVMLFPGMWPCIPGWHHDDVPRTRPLDGQPNYNDPANKAEHVMAVVGDCSLTEFVDETVQLPEVPLARKVYQIWDRYLEAMRPGTATVKSCDVVSFTWEALHRGTPATKQGWRFFIRASTSTTRKPRNEVRRQVQVYLKDPSLGW